MSGAYQTAKSIQRLEANLNRTSGRSRRKEKVKKTWRQRLREWFNKDMEECELGNIVVQDVAPSSLDSNGMRFHLYRASGGYVVETHYYDHKQDRHLSKLHIINEEEDVGHAIGKIITMESLR